jgi:hypothetical protein
MKFNCYLKQLYLIKYYGVTEQSKIRGIAWSHVLNSLLVNENIISIRYRLL